MSDRIRPEELRVRFCEEGFDPRFAVVLGSGLSAATDRLPRDRQIPFDRVEGLHSPSVKGHPGHIHLYGRSTILFAGRNHLYESGDMTESGAVVRVAARLGCRSILLTQAAGSLKRSIPVSSWLLPTDIISLPYRGAWSVDEMDSTPGYVGAGLSVGRGGRRTSLISARLRDRVALAAVGAGVELRDGVLFWATGPNYETAAEAVMAERLGASAATMSPLPELIAAVEARMDAACLTWITNHTVNVSAAETGHDSVVRAGKKSVESLLAILKGMDP
ncbi:MAG: purine-nucleoside phosphorylase [Candidatus Krumholzibacteria bacterium]|nr:purine-nucleoside phosphorylase [Candidatus Krumholzibacteria bacterium]